MSARDAIYSRVRAALGRTAGAAPAPAPPPRLAIPNTSATERVALFCTALEKLAGKTYPASSCEDAGALVRSIVADRPALSTHAPLLRQCGIAYPQIEPSKATVGVTTADFALADTGTLVVLASSEPRLASLLPPVHIAILQRERILASIDELFVTLPAPSDQTASMVLITGPSRTADIEQILVRGVHGPGELHVILL